MARGRTSRRRHRLRNQRHATNATHVARGILEPSYIQLLKWAKRNGISYSGLQPAMFADTGRGMLACRRVDSGDCVVSVPARMLITTRTAQKSLTWAPLAGKGREKMTARQMLTMFLLNEKFLGEESFWHPYICTLPTDFNTPSYFTEDELGCLPRSCRQECEGLRTSLYEQYCELKQLLQELDTAVVARFTFEEFCWAWAVVNTRSVYIEAAGQVPGGVLRREQDNCALAPVLDLLNHSDTAQVDAGFNSQTQAYEVRSISQYNKGCQVFINYGPHDNQRLLMEYGFVLPNNVHSVFRFGPEDLYSLIKPRNSISKKKLDIITKNKLENDLSCSREAGLSWSLLSMLRLLALDEKELDAWQKVLTGCPVSAVNEQQVQQWAVCLIQHALESCGSLHSVMIDNEKGLSTNMLLALQLRNEEVCILTEALEQFHNNSGCHYKVHFTISSQRSLTENGTSQTWVTWST